MPGLEQTDSPPPDTAWSQRGSHTRIFSEFLIERSLGAAAILFAACLAAAWSTELLMSVPGAGLSIWLPTGLLAAIAIASPMTKWPIWAAAAIAAEIVGNMLWYRHDWLPASVLIGGNILAALTGAWLVRRFVPFDHVFKTMRQAAIVLAIIALVMPLISATICSIGLGLSYGNAPLAAWQRLFLGDATGAVVAVPLGLLLLGAASHVPRLTRARRIEAALLTLVFVALATTSLGGFYPLAFIMITPLLWAALRFRIAGAIIAVAALAALSAFLTAADISPFAETAVYGRYGHQGLQIFLLVSATSALLVGAIAEEHREALRRLYEANRTLEQRVDERSALLVASEAQARENAALLAAIGEACPDLIFAKDLDFRMIYANSATIHALGLDKKERLLGKSEKEHIARAEEYAAIHRNDEEVLRTGETLVVEEVLTDVDGGPKFYRSTKAPLYDAEGALAGIAGVSVDITPVKKAEEREKLLVREIEHRARNLLAVVQGIVQLTKADSVAAFQSSIISRLRALARTNSAIAASNWEGASFEKILRDELEPYLDADDPRVSLTGDDVFVDSTTAQSLAMMVHELATNAAKYGALSTANGQIEIGWKRDRRGILVLEWTERGGPPVRVPKRNGFGSTIIKLFSEERPGGGVEYRWQREGLCVTITLPLGHGTESGVATG